MKWNLKTSRGKKILFPQILNERVGEKTELGDGFKRERESEGEREKDSSDRGSHGSALTS